jgi:hypothetical protein
MFAGISVTPAEGLAAANFPLIWRDATGGEAR